MTNDDLALVLPDDCTVLDLNGVLAAAGGAALQRKPYAFARLGHHEEGVIKGPAHFDVNLKVAAWPADWHLTAEMIESMRQTYPIAFAEMDCIGLSHGLADQYYVDEAMTLLERVGSRLHCIGPRFCRSMERHLPELASLLEGRGWIAIGMGADKWATALERLAGGTAAVWPWSDDAAVNDWTKYGDVLRWCEAQAPSIALIALGPWAVILAADLRRAGMVALDFGAGLGSLGLL